MSFIDIVRTVWISFFLEKYIVVLWSFVIQITPIFFFWLLFRKSVNFLFSYYSFCCNKMLSVSFLSVSGMHFCFWGFLSRMCVTARFLLIFKDLLITCSQTNKQMKTDRKNNSCVTIEWKLICLSCDAKECKHDSFLFKMYKSFVKESRELRTKCD